ncbi:DAK2 domain-containing protein [Deinococcus sp. Marseille-Q6407]|uniref:DAK2 domain-containing protein n=1 Tax=Deinococcus sp. Marseille-Q6407 TaxID=2969223 RepID=UPI0021C22183|nr:DAK2 domain-containing protein [Deinococcus sp. Marseille-Q6407]
MLRTATDWLGVHREQVNALNVYPVPDGDTGTNMHLTMQSVRRELDTCDTGEMRAVARAISYGALLGARGNSGVILSQLLRGFADSVRDLPAIDVPGLKRALLAARQAGYKAVMKPVEGTILTVARGIAEGAQTGSTVQEVLENAVARGQDFLLQTQDMLPALKQAGVVDSGGQGFLYVVRGMLAGLLGEALPPAPEIAGNAQESFEAEEYGYCTEFLMDEARLPIEDIRELVTPFGDSLLVVGAEGYVKGHIHTDRPDELLATVGRHGRMLRTKVEDMTEQHTEILAGSGSAAQAEGERPRSGLVAVASGDGIIKQFRALGARIVSGGQTSNPSVQDILDAVNSVSAETVIVLPNNKNVLMAADKAAELLGGRAVVVSTRTLGQGLGAALSFNADADAQELAGYMQESAGRVTTFEITRASRNTVHTTPDGRELDIHEGDVIGLKDDELVHAGGTPEAAVQALVRAQAADAEVVTVFRSVNTPAERLEELAQALEAEFPLLDIQTYAGGPELYDYLVTVE